jgi:putative oxidoreductase
MNFMQPPLARFASQTYAVLRIVAGLLFAMHGTQKLFGWPGGGNSVELMSLMGLAGIIEFVGGVMIAAGFEAGIAAFIASGQMAFAYFMQHAPAGPYPILNRGELAVLFCFLFLHISAHGSGIWSVDAGVRKSRR